jgi:cupin 2 domain-containing protein
MNKKRILHPPFSKIRQAKESATEVPVQASLVTIPESWNAEDELIEKIFTTATFRFERIISKGHTTPAGQWYDQDDDEWVALIQGEATMVLERGLLLTLHAGESLTIPAHCRHRVEFTSSDPPCVWLALHGRFEKQPL